MSDAVAYPLLILIAAGLIALALVWPQGQGAQSPAPFGHPPVLTNDQTATSIIKPMVLRGRETAVKVADKVAAFKSTHP